MDLAKDPPHQNEGTLASSTTAHRCRTISFPNNQIHTTIIKEYFLVETEFRCHAFYDLLPVPLKRPSKRKPPFLIALSIETSTNYGRQVLRGIQRFIKSNESQEWVAVLEQRELNTANPEWLSEWSGHGMISRSTTEKLKLGLRKNGIPFVDITDRYSTEDVVAIRSDDEAIGRMGAEHLVECVLPNFAFCGFEREAWSDRRANGFIEALEQKGIATHRLDSVWRSSGAKDWAKEKAKLMKWLKSLPKPVGIMACNDVRGMQLIDCCFQAGIDVPEEVAIVGVDNDELLCDLCHTPLTSILPNAEEVGFQSALTLSKMLASKKRKHPNSQLTIPPLGIVVRRSSDIVAVEDSDMAAALKLIREEACSGISVSEVVSKIEMSRSSIERKFRDLLGRTPQQEIRRIQLNKVCALLSSTDLPIESIAPKCGFEHPEYLHVVFKRVLSTTPGQFRNLNRS